MQGRHPAVLEDLANEVTGDGLQEWARVEEMLVEGQAHGPRGGLNVQHAGLQLQGEFIYVFRRKAIQRVLQRQKATFK